MKKIIFLSYLVLIYSFKLILVYLKYYTLVNIIFEYFVNLYLINYEKNIRSGISINL